MHPAKWRPLAPVIALLATAAWANPPWLGPVRTSGDVAVGPAGGHQELAAGAFGNGVALVTWHEHEAELYQAHVGATLIRADGTVITPYGFRMTGGTDDDYPLGVAFDGNNFLVVWNGPGFFATRVSQQGVVLDPLGIRLPGGASTYGASVAFDGTNFLVVWTDSNNSYDIMGARISPQGALVDTSAFPVSADTTGHEYAPQVAFGGGKYLVTWQSEVAGVRTIRSAFVRPSGTVEPEQPVSVGTGPTWSPHVAFDGANFLVAWEDGSTGNSDILAVRAAPTGGIGTPVTVAGSNTSDEVSPSVGFDGTNFLVAWRNNDGVLESARVSPGFTVLDTTPVTLTRAGFEYGPKVLTNPSGDRLVIWQDWRTGDEDIYSSRLSATATALDPGGFPVVVSAQRHWNPTVAATNGKVLVGWESFNAGARAVEALLDDGQTVTPVTLPVSVQPRVQPSVAGGPSGALVVFRQEDDVVAVRVGAAGDVLDAVPLNLSGSGAADQPRVAWDGTGWFVVWKDERTGGSGLYGARVSTSGVATPPGGFLIVGGGVDRKASAVSCLDARCLVAFMDKTNDRVGAVQVAGTTPGPAFDLTVDLGTQRDVDVANDSVGFLAVWRDSRRTGALCVARVSADGTLEDPSSKLIYFGSEAEHAALSWDGVRYLVTWDLPWGDRLDVVGTWLAADGTPVLDLPFPLADGPTEDTRARTVALGPGRLAMAWARFDATPGVDSMRIAVRRVSAVPRGAACTTDQECTTGYCTDGVCCDSACGGGAADCQACSAAAGAAVDGTCAVARAGAVCRAAAGECDVDETCDGVATTCAADSARPDGTACTGGACGSGRCLRTDRPVFTSVPEAALTCGKAWGYSAGGGAPQVSGTGPFTFAVRMADGSALPDGLSVDAASGALTWQPRAEQAGEYELELTVTSPTGSDSQRLRVAVECKPANLGVGCAAAPGVPWALVALVALARRRRQARR